MSPRVTIATAVAIMIFRSATAHADSDGYFCMGDGYLAYEMRLAEEPPGHTVQIIRFGPDIGIVKANPVVLDDFQTHGMACGTDYVRVDAFSRHYYVDISDRDQPKAYSGEPSRSVIPRGQQANLGHWSKEGVLTLTVNGSVGRFQLVIAKVSQNIPGGVEHHTITELIERGPRQEILRSIRLFSGIFLETVD